MSGDKRLWIAWEDDGSIRSRVLAKEMHANFYTFTLFEGVKFLFPIRYVIAVFQTILTLIKEKPNVFIVPDPSTFLSFLAALMKPFFLYKLVIDEHTPFPEDHPLHHSKGIKKRIIMRCLSNYFFRNCDILIVTNLMHKAMILKRTNKEIFVLPDKIPCFDYEYKETILKGKYNILFICTFSRDEPWNEVIESAKLLDNDSYIYISGRHNLNKMTDIPSNVVLTGFLTDESYQNLLRTVDAVIVLTEKENCLVCGGYEAVAAEKPLILSDTNALREYFSRGTVFAANNAEAIAASVKQAIESRDVMKEEIKKLKVIRNIEWRRNWENLMEKLG